MTEKSYYFAAALILAIVCAVVGAFLSAAYIPSHRTAAKTPIAPVAVPAQVAPSEIVFDPPAADEAPPGLRDTAMRGFDIIMKTRETAPAYVGNQLECHNCHFDGGRMRQTIILAGAAAQFPKSAEPGSPPITLEQQIAQCFAINLNAQAPPPGSNEMQALVTYIQWISTGVPIYSSPQWLDLAPLTPPWTPSPDRGMQHYSNICSTCHGPAGLGSDFAPPLWGNGSFTTASNMLLPGKLESFIAQFMPRGNPGLPETTAVDAAAFLRTQPRPQIKAAK